MLDKDTYFLSYSQRFTSINVPKARLPTAGTTASNEIDANRDSRITTLHQARFFISKCPFPYPFTNFALLL